MIDVDRAGLGPELLRRPKALVSARRAPGRWARALAVVALCGSGVARGQENHPSAFRVEVTGHGQPILLIPGLTNSGEVWTGTRDALRGDYEMHTLSLAGFAGVPPVAVDSTWLARQRDAIVTYIRAKRLQRPVLLGHSLGGVLALWIAATEPALVSAVINVDGLPFLGAATDPQATAASVRPQAERLQRALMAPEAANAYLRTLDQQVRALARDSSSWSLLARHGRESDMATVAMAMSQLLQLDLRPLLSRIVVPVLNVHAWAAFARNGQTRQGAEALLRPQYAELSTGRLRIHDAAYHYVMLDEPVWLHKEIRAFLSSDGPTGGEFRSSEPTLGKRLTDKSPMEEST